MAEERVGILNRKLVVEDNREAQALLGEHDENLKYLEELLPVEIVARSGEINIKGRVKDVEEAWQVLSSCLVAIREGHSPSGPDFKRALEMVRSEEAVSPEQVWKRHILVTDQGRKVVPKSIGQFRYLEAIRQCDLVFAVGPAGTGKTYLAMAAGISMLKDKQVEKVILSRPAVEAGERLGFLPGALEEKVHPYLRPLYDALYEFLAYEKAERLSERGTLEVVPLAYMRGRTLSNAFVILDEAQNTTREQMKMFLTRLGVGSRAVVTGDITQIDLPNEVASGMIDARRVLADVPGIAFVELTEKDVVRHPLVRDIIKAYAADSREARGRCEEHPPGDS